MREPQDLEFKHLMQQIYPLIFTVDLAILDFHALRGILPLSGLYLVNMNLIQNILRINKKKYIRFRLNEDIEEVEVKLLYYLNCSAPYKMMLSEKKLTSLKSENIEINRGLPRTLPFGNSYRTTVQLLSQEENPTVNCIIHNPHYLGKPIAIFLPVLFILLNLTVVPTYEPISIIMAVVFLGFAAMWEFRDQTFFRNSSNELTRSLTKFFPKLEVVNES